MFLIIALILSWGANLWASWMLGSGVGILSWIVITPILAVILIGGGLAIGLVNIVTSTQYEKSALQRFVHGFLRGWGWLIFLSFIAPWCLWGMIFMTNTWFPASLPRITMTNDEKTVVFQSMMHIASPEFYDSIKKDMQELSTKDFVFFYEGVRADSPESLEKLSILMGTDISEEMYTTLGTLAGLRFQGAVVFDDILPSTNVDLSTDDIVALAESQNISPTTSSQADWMQTIAAYYPSFNAAQKYLIHITARASMNILLRIYEHPSFVEKMYQQMPVLKIILDERNAVLAKAINTSPASNIYIHYGALHYSGVLAELQKTDIRWREVARREYSAIVP